MWFLPSYGRPERLRELLEAPGGWPDEVVVLINADDPKHARYFELLNWLKTQAVPWRLAVIPDGSRCADAHRAISKRWPDEPFYGLLCDDHWPITPGWHDAVVEAAGKTCIATPNGEPLFPKLRNALVIGGDLARAMGSLVPAPVKHNYEDNIWDQIAEDFDCLRPLKDVFVEHKHWLRGDAEKDATYVRGSSDIEDDRKIFEAWMRSDERVEMNRRLAPMFGKTVSAVDSSTIRLTIVTPMQDEQVDVAYHSSLQHTLIELARRGVQANVRQTAGGSHIGKARENLLWQAMRTNPTHLMFIDADMGWQPKAVARLLSADLDFCAVAGVYKQEEVKACANFLPGDQNFHAHTHFLEVRDVGFAFVMLKASVIEKMCAAYPELQYDAGEHDEYALFLDMIDKSEGEHGTRLSEDLSFCRRWRAIGGQIWLDSQMALIHAGRKEYTGRVCDLFETAA